MSSRIGRDRKGRSEEAAREFGDPQRFDVGSPLTDLFIGTNPPRGAWSRSVTIGRPVLHVVHPGGDIAAWRVVPEDELVCFFR